MLKNDKKNSGKYKVVVLTQNNFTEWITLPAVILEKYRLKKFNTTHLSDIIRFYILARYGGLWLDATCLLYDSLDKHTIIYKEFYTQKFFVNKIYNEGFDYNPSLGRWATFAMGTNIKNNPLYIFGCEFYHRYWQENNELIHYFLMDFIIDIAYNNNGFVRKMIDDVPLNNVHIHDATKENKLDTNKLNDNISLTSSDEFLYKLSWKNHVKTENFDCFL